MSSRPEYVTCVLTGRYDIPEGEPGGPRQERKTWCGREPAAFDVVFLNASHAALSARALGHTWHMRNFQIEERLAAAFGGEWTACQRPVATNSGIDGTSSGRVGLQPRTTPRLGVGDPTSGDCEPRRDGGERPAPLQATGRRVAIVGCRPGDYARTRAILDDVLRFVDDLPRGTVVISGGAVGVDFVAEVRAIARELDTSIWRPDYKRHGSRAPLERNSQIVADCDELHAWPAPWSRGTFDAIQKARDAGKPVIVHDPTHAATRTA